MLPLSVLDLSPVPEGADAATALANTVDLAILAEQLGYHRYWLAEHHNMAGIASAATAVVIGRVAAATRTIRVGSGGIMLPNHSPLVIAEQFGTLASLFPNRIDLGLGRAPGTDQLTAQAMRRDLHAAAEHFPQDVIELIRLFEPAQPGQKLRAVPGEGLRVPVFILGSSLFGAQLAAMLGLPFAFASHFAPAQLHEALHIYRTRYEPSERWPQPHAIVAIGAVAAETDAAAELLFTSQQQAVLNLRRGMPGRLPAPDPTFTERLTPMERHALDQWLAYSVVGGPDRVRQRLAAIVAETQADEIIATGQIFDHAARRRSFELLATARNSLALAA
ncbi:alkane 1-monooxygenase [Prosthecomicrobium hirschii]|uniref:LLM class flavin-dependent oxidoreductase n=1 Tax=Prosthecodimorpha hirschii TaxID=665126 RepID=UPI00112A1AA7|nr:LLM class flavin-dependent oxidoreductase [Prosthecomicrobium hirschii]TPQ44224.1 alkane 1-monooxygenase [Prosthecomicrobium hirschii]